MKVKIAICDDEQHICSQLEELLIETLKEKSVDYEIDVFYSGTVFCKQLKNKEYDLIFLDIELPQNSGIDVGKYIRETLGNEEVQIAYISAKERYAMKLFDFRPINFLVKPLDRAKVDKVLKKYFTITKQNDIMFEYKKRAEYYRIPMSEIMYLESKGRKVRIHSKKGEDEFYGSLEKIYSNKLKNHKFLFIHKSIIVNYHYIKRISYEEVTMLNDVVLPISQSHRKAIKTIYLQMRKGEM